MKVLIIYLDSQDTSVIAPCIHAGSQLAKADALIFGKAKIKDITGVAKLTHYPKLTRAKAKDIAPIIQKHCNDYTHILLHSDTIGIAHASYLSGYLNIPSLIQITKIISTDTYQCKKQTLQINAKRHILAISGLYFRKTLAGKPIIKIIQTESAPSIQKKNDLKAVIALGNGASSTIEPLLALAKQLNARIYASKPIIDKQYLKPSSLLGISGENIQTPLYIAMGILGDDYHMLGVQSSLIIAINSDPNAPIFTIADYGYIGKIQDVLPLFQKYKLCLDIIP